ncbi:hypothetical protein MMC30_004282 [Trapelia coarctata]|nr:hypothetical protein [Trapelia coarctata]
MLQFGHRHCLRNGEIRIIKLHRGAENDPVEWSYEYHYLHHHVEYESLSYTWGEAAASRRAFVHDQNEVTYLYIRPNLELALRRLRRQDEERYLWVDALCIDQTPENGEKDEQIASMDRIYNHATRVCIWLGGEAANSDLAMKFLDSILDLPGFATLVADDAKSQEWQAFVDLMRRPWFTRRWVVQEVALARKARLYCGNSSVDWPRFADAVELFGSHSLTVSKMLEAAMKGHHKSNTYEELQRLGAYALVNVTNNLFLKYDDGSVYRRLASLEYLVFRLTAFNVSEPRDMVFALRSLAKEVRGSVDLKIDSSRPLIEICKDVVELSVQESGSLDIICRPWAPATLEACTWIRHATESQFVLNSEGMRANADRFVGQPDQPTYRASGLKRAEVDFRFSKFIPTTLKAKGIFVDSVCKTGGAVVDGLIPSDWLRLGGWNDVQECVPERFWRILVADRGPYGDRPPSWYKRACMHAWYQSSISTRALHTPTALKAVQSAQAEEFIRRVQSVIWGRSFIVTKNFDYIGLGPATTNTKGSTDIICILYGMSVPVVLRPRHRGSFYNLIGEAYIHGIMNGEVIPGTEQVFCIR